MKLNLKDAYMREVEFYLGNLNSIDRASVIKELEKNIFELENDGTGKNIDAILRFLGEPKEKARDLLKPYSVKTSKNKSSISIFKFLMGLAAFFFILVATIIIVAVMKFTPLISIDSSSNSVKLLGGTINIDGQDNGLNSNIIQISKGAAVFSGQLDLGTSSRLKVLFSNANFKIKNSENKLIEYQCEKTPNDHDKDFSSNTEGNSLVFNFENLSGVDCDLSIPKNIEFELNGENLNLLLTKLSNGVSVKAENGKIEFEPSDKDQYNFDIVLGTGASSNFPTTKDLKFYNVKLELKNGMVNYLH